MEMILETIMKRKTNQMMRVIPMMKTMEKTPRTTSQMMKVIPTETAMGTANGKWKWKWKWKWK